MRTLVKQLVQCVSSSDQLDHDSVTAQAGSWLIALLGDPDFALAQSARVGAEDSVNDFVTAHHAVAQGDPSSARTLSRAIAAATVLDSTRGDPVLSTDVLHALLGYRDDTTIYGEALDFGTDSEFVAGLIVDPRLRPALLSGFLHCSATRRRRLGGSQNLEAAKKVLLDARDLCGQALDSQATGSKTEGLLSSILYDLAYIDFLTGERSAAQSGFQRSADAAKRAGHLTGYYMSLSVEHLVGFYAATVRAEAFRALLNQALQHFASVAKQDQHARRWVMNAHAHLFDLACMEGDLSSAELELEALETDPWVASFLQFGAVPTWRARHHLVRREWQRASDLYGSLLANELEGPSLREAAARDLLDYGVALDGTGDRETARRVWELGLRCPDDAGNWPWKPRIERRLATLRRGS